jgi:hypothetical protein
LYKEIADLTLPTTKRNARQLAEQIVSALEEVVPAAGP